MFLKKENNQTKLLKEFSEKLSPIQKLMLEKTQSEINLQQQKQQLSETNQRIKQLKQMRWENFKPSLLLKFKIKKFWTACKRIYLFTQEIKRYQQEIPKINQAIIKYDQNIAIIKQQIKNLNLNNHEQMNQQFEIDKSLKNYYNEKFQNSSSSWTMVNDDQLISIPQQSQSKVTNNPVENPKIIELCQTKLSKNDDLSSFDNICVS